jgi:hypothetical protein
MYVRCHMFHLTAVRRDRSNAVERSLEYGRQAETFRIEIKRLTKIVPHWFYSIVPEDVSTKAMAVISVSFNTVMCCATFQRANFTSLSTVLPSAYLGFVY